MAGRDAMLRALGPVGILRGQIMKTLLAALLLSCACTALGAQSINSAAPDFTMGGLTCPTDAVTREACLGSVVVIKIWGIT